MNPTELTRKMILDYPSLFETRGDVLDHVLCTNGNGFEWQDGEPVAIFPTDPRARPDYSSQEAFVAWYLDYYKNIYGPTSGLVHEISVEQAKKSYVKWSQVRANVDAGAQNPHMTHPESRYPLCEYAKLATLPDNVTPEWLDAAVETLHEIETDPRGWHKANPRDTAENLQWCIRIELELDRRFRRSNIPRTQPERDKFLERTRGMAYGFYKLAGYGTMPVNF